MFLDGPLGAGKTSLARGLIAHRLGPGAEVPSPTFTLLQTYDGDPPIWHFDLYRLEDPDEIWELGWEDRGAAACLIEWPQRLGHLAPSERLTISLSFADDGRLARLDAQGDSWASRLDGF